MAVEVITRNWCDRHLSQFDERVEGSEVRVSLPTGDALVDLCDPCRKELVDPLVSLAAEQGRSPDGRRRLRYTPLDLACPECGRTGFTRQQGLTTHLTRTHKLSIAQAHERANA